MHTESYWDSPVTVSIPQINMGLFKYLSNHPLLIGKLVYHPITKEHVPIAYYRQKDGVTILDGLSCSIFPAFASDGSYNNASTTSVSAIFKDINLGSENTQEVLYHFIVKFSLPEVSLGEGTKLTDKETITVLKEAATRPEEVEFISEQTKTIELFIDPPSFILGTYLELVRLAIYDEEYRYNHPIAGISSIEVVHYNAPTQVWDDNANVYFNSAYLYLRINGYVEKGWRDAFIQPLQKVNIEVLVN